MGKILQEIRDPIHDFIMLDDDELKVVDSRPFQRLRHIPQLATTFLVYPGATHRRFEHSLGVMELASRFFAVITAPQNVDPSIKKLVPNMAAILNAAANPSEKGHDPANRIVNRKHFKLLYQRNPEDVEKNPEPGKLIYHAACKEFGKENVR